MKYPCNLGGRCRLWLPSIMVAVPGTGRAAAHGWRSSARTASNEIATVRIFFPATFPMIASLV